MVGITIRIREKLESIPISMNELEGVAEGAGREVGFQDGVVYQDF